MNLQIGGRDYGKSFTPGTGTLLRIGGGCLVSERGTASGAGGDDFLNDAQHIYQI